MRPLLRRRVAGLPERYRPGKPGDTDRLVVANRPSQLPEATEEAADVAARTALKADAVPQDDLREIERGSGGQHWPVEASIAQHGQATDVVVMPVGEQHRVHVPGRIGKGPSSRPAPCATPQSMSSAAPPASMRVIAPVTERAPPSSCSCSSGRRCTSVVGTSSMIRRSACPIARACAKCRAGPHDVAAGRE